MTHRVLVTGAAGYLGSHLVATLAGRAARDGDPACIVATDVRDVPAGRRLPGVEYVTLDVRAPSPDGYGMHGSGMFVLNPPWTLKATLEKTLPYLARVLAEDAGAGYTLTHEGD